MPIFTPPAIPGLTVTGGVVTINDASADQDFRVESDGNTHMLYVDAGNDRVGIGTATPLTTVDIEDGLTTVGAVLTLSTKEPTVVDGDVIGRLNFRAPLETGADALLLLASIHAEADAAFDATTNSTELVFSTASGDAAAERMRLTHDGLLGIGTASPTATLDVVGDVRFRASVEVCTSDPAPATAESGTVYQFTKGSAGVFTLPASPPVGTQFVLVNGDGQDIVITRPHASVKINGATANATNTTAYAATSIVAVVSNGNSSEWLAFGGI